VNYPRQGQTVTVHYSGYVSIIVWYFTYGRPCTAT